MKKIMGIIQKHIRSNILIYFITLLFYTIGIVAGTYTTIALASSQKLELGNYLEGFLQILKTNNIDSLQLLFQSLLNNFKFFFLIWVLGLIIIGVVIVPILIGIKGFILGFTLGFIIEELAFKGFMFIMLAILPHNLFYLPALIGIGVMATSFSLYILKNKIKKQQIHNKRREIWTYTIIMMIISVLLIIGSIIEAYITPLFMKVLFNI